MTRLDEAHAAMMASPEDDAARLRFYAALADSELFLLLAGEPEGDRVAPEIFDIADGRFALVFDSEDRLSEFTGRVVPYAGLPGRGLAGMLAGQGIGLALNLQVAPSEMLIPAEAVDWLVATLDHAPVEAEARIEEVTAPVGLPDAVTDGLRQKLALVAGMAAYAYLAAARYQGGGSGHVLAFVGARDGAEQALAHAAGEALRFSGIEAGQMDVLFVQPGDVAEQRLAQVGVRFDIPQPQARPAPVAPGSDPEKPPRLR